MPLTDTEEIFRVLIDRKILKNDFKL